MKGGKRMQILDMQEVKERKRNMSPAWYKESHVALTPNILSTNFDRLVNIGYSKIVAENVLRQMPRYDNSDFAFRQMLEVYEMICENENASYISLMANVIVEAASKTRSGTQTKDYLKMKVRRFKTKLHTKFNNNIDDIKTAASNTVDAMKKNLAVNTQQIAKNVKPAKKDEAAKEEAILAGYEKIYEAYMKAIDCDRILENHAKISKHYNLNEIIRDNYDDHKQAIIEICSAIDSFKMPDNIKYNVSLENILYSFAECNIPVDKQAVAETVTDYYLIHTYPLTDSAKASMVKIFENSSLFSESDKCHISNMFKDIAKLDIKFDDTFILLQEKPDMSKYINENELISAMLKEAGTKTNAVKVLFDKFKLEAEKTPEKLRAVINRMYVQSPDEIIEELPNLLSWIRSFLVVGGGVAIHPIVGIVALIVDQAIKITLTRKQLTSYITKFESELTKTKKALDKATKDKEKERLEAYKKQLEKNIQKLKDKEDKFYTDDENDERHLGDDDDSDMDDLFNFSFDESAEIVLTEMDISNTMKMTKEKLKDVAKGLSDTEKNVSRNIDVACSQFSSAAEKALTNDNREAVIRGSLIPSASKVIKNAIIAGAGWAVNPALAVIGVIGSIAISKKLQAKERQLILDDIEIELNMCERYLKIAEDNNDMKAQRNLLMTKRSLERQRQRIRYRMAVYHNQKVDIKGKGDDDE